ncbi:Hypothetical predicted protein, partial [Marmota monax]
AHKACRGSIARSQDAGLSSHRQSVLSGLRAPSGFSNPADFGLPAPHLGLRALNRSQSSDPQPTNEETVAQNPGRQSPVATESSHQKQVL